MFQGQIGKIVLQIPGNQGIFQFCLYISASPSLKFGLPTTKIIILELQVYVPQKCKFQLANIFSKLGNKREVADAR